MAADDLRGGERIAAAELAGGNQDTLVSAHGDQFAQHAFGGSGAHGDSDDFAAGLVLQLQGGFHSVHIIGVDDGGHGRTDQNTIFVNSNLTGGIRDLLDTNKNFHFNLYLLNYLTPICPEMTMRWTSEVPS